MMTVAAFLLFTSVSLSFFLSLCLSARLPHPTSTWLSTPMDTSYLSQLPAYRAGVSPLLRGVEIGLAHGFLLIGPFYKTGPLRNTVGRRGDGRPGFK